jgi:two-component system sensor histidine kinase KdpD
VGRGYAFAFAAVALVTAFVAVALQRIHLGNVAMLYLIGVLATAALYGSRPAIAAAVAAFVASNYLFIEPRYTLHVDNPDDVVALSVFLATALITGQLAAALRRRAEEAEQHERTRAEAEILRRTDELRTALIHAVSHDLRTPLSSIIASAGGLRQADGGWSAEERAELAGTIEEEARRLNRIVGNLLDLSRIEAGALKPQKDWYDLSALVDDVVGRLRGVTAGRKVEVDMPYELPSLLIDYVEIDQVLSNLIENAVKHTPAGTDISVGVRAVGNDARVEVADQGPGLPPGALERLFEPFYRADAHRAGHGTGIGLAVARGLVEAHGGRVWAENRPEGGARFVFTLPMAAGRGEVSEVTCRRAPREAST